MHGNLVNCQNAHSFAGEPVTVFEALSDLYEEENGLMNSCRLEPQATSKNQEYLKDGSEYVFDHEIHYPAQKVQDRMY